MFVGWCRGGNRARTSGAHFPHTVPTRRQRETSRWVHRPSRTASRIWVSVTALQMHTYIDLSGSDGDSAKTKHEACRGRPKQPNAKWEWLSAVFGTVRIAVAFVTSPPRARPFCSKCDKPPQRVPPPCAGAGSGAERPSGPPSMRCPSLPSPGRSSNTARRLPVPHSVALTGGGAWLAARRSGASARYKVCSLHKGAVSARCFPRSASPLRASSRPRQRDPMQRFRAINNVSVAVLSESRQSPPPNGLVETS